MISAWIRVRSIFTGGFSLPTRRQRKKKREKCFPTNLIAVDKSSIVTWKRNITNYENNNFILFIFFFSVLGYSDRMSRRLRKIKSGKMRLLDDFFSSYAYMMWLKSFAGNHTRMIPWKEIRFSDWSNLHRDQVIEIMTNLILLDWILILFYPAYISFYLIMLWSFSSEHWIMIRLFRLIHHEFLLDWLCPAQCGRSRANKFHS